MYSSALLSNIDLLYIRYLLRTCQDRLVIRDRTASLTLAEPGKAEGAANGGQLAKSAPAVRMPLRTNTPAAAQSKCPV